MFLVKDLNSLLVQLRDLKVNAGPQSERGKCSYLDANLVRVDMALRRSMYLSSKWYNLNPRDFYFKNLHMNLGKVRLYSYPLGVRGSFRFNTLYYNNLKYKRINIILLIYIHKFWFWI